jgi:hypothetical protein
MALGCFVWLISKPAEASASPKSPDSHKNHSGSAGGTSFEGSNGNTNHLNPNKYNQTNIESSRSPAKSPVSTTGELQGAESSGKSHSNGQAERANILEKVHDAAVTYDPASLPIIEPYLNSPDPEVRLEAMNAVVTLGDVAGAPLLRAQAAKESDPLRKKELLDFAAWLELPPAQFVMPKKKNSQTPVQK